MPAILSSDTASLTYVGSSRSWYASSHEQFWILLKSHDHVVELAHQNAVQLLGLTRVLLGQPVQRGFSISEAVGPGLVPQLNVSYRHPLPLSGVGRCRIGRCSHSTL